jgi:hypothetical protein
MNLSKLAIAGLAIGLMALALTPASVMASGSPTGAVLYDDAVMPADTYCVDAGTAMSCPDAFDVLYVADVGEMASLNLFGDPELIWPSATPDTSATFTDLADPFLLIPK